MSKKPLSLTQHERIGKELEQMGVQARSLNHTLYPHVLKNSKIYQAAKALDRAVQELRSQLDDLQFEQDKCGPFKMGSYYGRHTRTGFCTENSGTFYLKIYTSEKVEVESDGTSFFVRDAWVSTEEDASVKLVVEGCLDIDSFDLGLEAHNWYLFRKDNDGKWALVDNGSHHN